MPIGANISVVTAGAVLAFATRVRAGRTGTTADPLPREDSAHPAADEYGYGNQW